MNLKQTKSVRFNDGIEVHSVSPSHPLYKLKPLGRLFDEPSVVRAVNELSYSKHELPERIEDSDSDFDADTGITSDVEDIDVEDSSQIEDYNKDIEISRKEKESILHNAETKTVYDCSEDDSLSTDHEICKEGNDLILRSKMITVVQGKWVRETKQIIENTCNNKDFVVSNRKYIKATNPDEERQELGVVRNIEQILENIKNLYISNIEEHGTSSVTISSIERSDKINLKVKKEQLMVGSVKLGQDLTDIKITLQDEDELKHNMNKKISLENESSLHLVDEKLLTIDNNKLSYEHDIYEPKSNIEGNTQKRIRSKPIKLVDDLIDYINDWNSSNESSLSRTSFSKSVHTKDQERRKYLKPINIEEVQNTKDDISNSEYLLIKKPNFLEKEVRNLELKSLNEKTYLGEEVKDLDDLSHKAKKCLDKEGNFTTKGNQCVENEKDNFKNLSLDGEICLIKQESSLNIQETIKREPPTLTNEIRNKTGYETHYHIANFNEPFSTKDEIFREKEFQSNDTFTIIQSMLGNQSTSNPNELYSTFSSLITKPILIQSQSMEEEDDKKNNSNKSHLFEAEELDHKKSKIQKENELGGLHNWNIKTQGMEERDDAIFKNIDKRLREENTENNSKEHSKIIVKPELLKDSIISMASKDHSPSTLATSQPKDQEVNNISPKICITDERNSCDKHPNVLNTETSEIQEHQAAMKPETNNTNFLSKIQMWSIHSKKYLENLKMNDNQNSSLIASCNTDSLQEKIFDIEDSSKIGHEYSDESYNNSSYENSFTSRNSDNEDDNISEDLVNSGEDLGTASTTRSVTPVKIEKNSEEVSTAYETDPETGKLAINRYLPLSNSTPIKLKQFHKQDCDPERHDYNIIEELSTHSSHYIKADNGLVHDKNNESWRSISVIDESTIKSESQSKTKNIPTESLLAATDERDKTKSNERQERRELNHNKEGKPKYFTESFSKKHTDVLSDKPPYQQTNSYNSISDSIIGNSQNDSSTPCKRENDTVETSKTRVYKDKQDQFVAEKKIPKTHTNLTETSSTLNFKYPDTFTVGETVDSYSDQERNSNEASKTNEINSTNNQVIGNLQAVEQASANSHSSDIIYDFSNITEVNKFGQNRKSSTAGFDFASGEEHKILESENLVNKNELNASDESIKEGKRKNLSAVSETIINDNSKTASFTSVNSKKEHHNNKIFNPTQSRINLPHSPLTHENSELHNMISETQKTELSLQNHKNISKNRQGNVSHITFLIRDPASAEDRPSISESRYQQHSNLSSSVNPLLIKRHNQNEEHDINEILSDSGKKIPKEKEEVVPTIKDTSVTHASGTSKVFKSNLIGLDKNSSNFSIGVENSQYENPLLSHNNEYKYFRGSSTYLSLKRKLATINENDNSSNTSLSQDELPKKEIKTNSPSNVHLRRVAGFSGSHVTTDTSSIEMNFKRVNTDIRRKRARMKKENRAWQSSTSSSEDEIKRNKFKKSKNLESRKSPLPGIIESRKKMKPSNKFNQQNEILEAPIQHNPGRSHNNTNISSNLSSLALSFENQTSNVFSEQSMNAQKRKEFNQFSDSSSSIIYSSPYDEKRHREKNIRKYSSSKTNLGKIMKKRHSGEDNSHFSDTPNIKNINDKSHKSYPICRKYDESIKENLHIPRSSEPDEEYPKKPLKQSNIQQPDPILGRAQGQNDEAKLSDQNMKKNRKSSIVRLMGMADMNQISNSPEVKGLLRRTYFMGNN